MAITGDSIVKGIGDTDPDFVGYPGRLQAKFNFGTISNIGVAGITSEELIRAFKKNLPEIPPGTTAEKSRNSDIFIIAVGINDYWSFRPPAFTVRNITRLVSYLRTALKRMDGTSPIIAVATLTHTNRGFQQPFVNAVNAQLLAQKSQRLPVYVRFESLQSKFLNADGLHPNAKGYDKLSKIVSKYIRGLAQEQSLASRPDFDGDGVYDFYETTKYGTNPQQVDTDSDGLSDGDELFKYSTNPLTADSDGNGIGDYEQILHVTPTPTH